MKDTKHSVYEALKSGLKKVAIAYAVCGSLYMCSVDTTGHHSADVRTCRAEPGLLEKALANSLGFDISQPQCEKK